MHTHREGHRKDFFCIGTFSALHEQGFFSGSKHNTQLFSITSIMLQPELIAELVTAATCWCTCSANLACEKKSVITDQEE